MWCWLGIGKDFKPVGLPTAVEKDDAHDFFWEPFFKLVKFLALLFLMTFFSETHMVHHILILDRLSVSQVWCPRATLELALFCFWWVGMLIWFWGFFLHMSILCIFNWHPRYKWRSNRNFFEISRLAKQSVMPPHDILASLYNYPEVFHPIVTGEPGRLQQYWAQNEDLYESLGMPDLEAWLFNMFFPVYNNVPFSNNMSK